LVARLAHRRQKKTALNLLESNYNEGEQENAVFVLSQLPSEQFSAVLFNIIKGDYARNIKKKALFWLSQSDDERVLSQLGFKKVNSN